ncbi:hypothetical protein E3G68_005031 [Mycobacteroides abscessus]|nr:hypothetical protein [Mycobacteroides abscessus]
MSYQDSSHGSAYPRHRLGAARNRDLRIGSAPSQLGLAAGSYAEQRQSPAVQQRLRRIRIREQRRDWVQRAGETAPSTPMWTSRAGWIRGVQAWAQSDELHVVCASARVSITSSTLTSVAKAWAQFADHGTGRNAAVTRVRVAQAAGCDPRTVTRAWKVLGAAGWAVEAARGHGSSSRASCGNRPSIWHLVSRKVEPTDLSQPVEFVHLPPSRRDRRLSPVSSKSPKARPGAPARKCHPPVKKCKSPARAAPRPLALQRLAAELVTPAGRPDPLCRGLDRGHIGAICDAISSAGIDPAVWSARSITEALNRDMRARGWSWPNEITNPGSFLASRLRLLAKGANAGAARGHVAAGQGGHAAAIRPAMAEPGGGCEQFSAAELGAPTESVLTPAVGAAAAVGEACVVCCGPRPVRRPFLPTHRAYVCDPCWNRDVPAPEDVSEAKARPPG